MAVVSWSLRPSSALRATAAEQAASSRASRIPRPAVGPRYQTTNIATALFCHALTALLLALYQTS
jgi:hypothetical protein